MCFPMETEVMNPMEAQQIIEGLARGLDTSTGEVMPDSSPLSEPHVIRALFMAARALKSALARLP